MRDLSLASLTQVAGGNGLSVYLKASIPLSYLPVIESYITSASEPTLTGLVFALTLSGLDPKTFVVDVDVSYFTSNL